LPKLVETTKLGIPADCLHPAVYDAIYAGCSQWHRHCSEARCNRGDV